METATSGVIRQTCDTYDNYIGSLNLMCVSGSPGTLVWTPDENTPDLVYYQVNTQHVYDLCRVNGFKLENNLNIELIENKRFLLRYYTVSLV